MVLKDTYKKEEKVGIIGAGEVGANLLKIFLQMPSINIKYVSDLDLQAPGMLLAKENDLRVTTEIMDVIKDQELDLILEVTGSQQVLNIIKENKSSTTEVISGETSYLIFNMIEEYKRAQSILCQTVVNHLTEIHTAIEDNSYDVNESIGEIEKVTNNLNILAINASIEAARAGKEGRGFSVVANEVKDLATQSSQLVNNIEEINHNIINLNDRITDVVDDFRLQMLDLDDNKDSN